jgi:PAS domain S-box-containing protein
MTVYLGTKNMLEALAPSRTLPAPPWPLVAAIFLVMQSGMLLVSGEWEMRLAWSSAILLVVLVVGTSISIQNALQNKHSIRLFWAFMATGLGLWAVNPLLGILYAAGPGRSITDPILSASILFLHTVMMLMSVACRPHVRQLDQRTYATPLNFLLFLFFWMFLYVFFLIPDLYLNWKHIVVEWFSILYFAENSVLIIFAATVTARTAGVWKVVYGSILGASLLYACGSLLMNLNVARGIYFPGFLDLATTGAACVLVWAAVQGRKLAPQLSRAVLVERNGRHYPMTFAVLSLTIVPLLGLWELAQLKELASVHTLRLFAVLVAGLLLTLVAFIREYLQQRRFVFDLDLAHDQLNLAMQSGKSIGWDLNVSTREGFWFGDLRTFFGILGTSYVGPAREFYRSIHPDDRQHLLQAMLRAARNSTSYTAVFRLVQPGGAMATRWLTSRGRFYYNSWGKPIRMLGIAIDINEQKQSEEALRESEVRFREMANAAPLLLWMSGKDQRREYFNQSWLGFTGQSESSDEWLEYIHPEDRERYLRTCQEAFITRRPFQAEYRLRQWCDGDYRWILENCAPRFTPANLFKGYIGCGIDVTEMRRAEKQIALANERLQLALEAGGAEVWDLDIRTGNSIRLGNHQALFGTSTPPQTMQEFWDCVYADDLAHLRQGMESARQKKTRFSENFRVISPDGGIRWLHLEGEFIYSPDGHAERMLGITSDVTERKSAAEAMEKSEEEFSLAFEAARLGWWVWSEETGLVTLSKGTREILGLFSETEITLDKFLNTVLPEDRERVYREWWQSFNQGARYLVDYRILRPDGAVRWVEARGHAFSGSRGRLPQIVGVTIDISERKRSEEALRSLGGRLIQAQEQERIRISRELHDDICQRLALLGLELESLRDDPELNEPRLREAAGHLVQFTIDIGSSVQALSHELHSSKLEILGITPAMKSFCAEFSRQYHVKVEFGSNISRTLPRELSVCLYRVLQEALHNGVKHSGVKQFFVQLRNESAAVELTIKDLGAGFNVEAGPVQRGLGLISMQERVNLVNGTFSIESEAGYGTTIRARVPLEDKLAAA